MVSILKKIIVFTKNFFIFVFQLFYFFIIIAPIWVTGAIWAILFKEFLDIHQTESLFSNEFINNIFSTEFLLTFFFFLITMGLSFGLSIFLFKYLKFSFEKKQTIEFNQNNSCLLNKNTLNNSYVIKSLPALTNKNYRKALNLYTQAIKKNPRNPDLYLLRSLCKSCLQDKTKIIDRHIYENLKENPNFLDENNPNLYLLKAHQAKIQENWQEFVKQMQKALKLMKKENISAENYSNLGNAYFELGKYKQASKYFNKSIKISREFTELYIYHLNSNALLFIEKFKESLKNIKKAIKINSTLTELYLTKGLCEFYLKKYNNAIKDFDIYLTKYTKHIDIIFYKSCCEYQLGKIEEALKNINQILKLDPQYKNAICSLFSLENELGYFKSAKINAQKALNLFPNDYRTLTDLGRFKIEHKEYKEAIKLLTKSIKIKKSAHAYFFLGVAKKLLGKEKSAKLDFNKATTLDKKVYDHKAMLLYYFRTKNYDQALKEFNGKRNTVPYPSEYFYKGVIELKMGNTTEALKTLKKAQKLGYYKAKALIKKIKENPAKFSPSKEKKQLKVNSEKF